MIVSDQAMRTSTETLGSEDFYVVYSEYCDLYIPFALLVCRASESPKRYEESAMSEVPAFVPVLAFLSPSW